MKPQSTYHALRSYKNSLKKLKQLNAQFMCAETALVKTIMEIIGELKFEEHKGDGIGGLTNQAFIKLENWRNSLDD